MNDTFEILFQHFLETAPTGELAEAMHKISAELDRQIEAGAVEHLTLADYECAAARYGFYAGFAAAQDLQMAKIRLARDRQKQAQGTA